MRSKAEKLGDHGVFFQRTGRLEILEEALREEKDVKIYTGILAVRFSLLGNSAASTVVIANATQRTIQLRIVRFNEDGVKGLYPATERGRRPKASYTGVSKLAIRLCNRAMLTPKKLHRRVRSRIGLGYGAGNARRILRELGLSRKTPVVNLGDAADAKKVTSELENVHRMGVKHAWESVHKNAKRAHFQVLTCWQADTKRAIAGTKRAGFRMVVQDESIFIRVGGDGDGAKLWSPMAQRVRVGRSGRRGKIAVYGSIADDGTRSVRTYDRFNGANFVRYLEPARQRWGKVQMIPDNASWYKTRRSADTRNRIPLSGSCTFRWPVQSPV